MNLSNRALSLFLWLVSSASVASASPLIPLQKGTVWIYEGTIEWQQASEIKREKIRLMTEVIESLANRKTRIAVVRDFPLELNWYENNKLPRYSVLIETKMNIYYLSAESKDESLRLARELMRNSVYHAEDSILFYPLLKCERHHLHIKGLDTLRKFKCEQSSRRTNPDIEKIDFALGLGITRYYYNHFGTTALVNIELKEVRFAKKINRNGKLKSKSASVKK